MLYMSTKTNRAPSNDLVDDDECDITRCDPSDKILARPPR